MYRITTSFNDVLERMQRGTEHTAPGQPPNDLNVMITHAEAPLPDDQLQISICLRYGLSEEIEKLKELENQEIFYPKRKSRRIIKEDVALIDVIPKNTFVNRTGGSFQMDLMRLTTAAGYRMMGQQFPYENPEFLERINYTLFSLRFDFSNRRFEIMILATLGE